MSEPRRLRKRTNVTLNPALSERLREYGLTQGKTEFSRLVDECMEEYLRRARWWPNRPAGVGGNNSGISS